MKIAYIVEPRKVIGGGVRAAMNLAKGLKLFYRQDSRIFGIYPNTVTDTDIHFIPVDTLKPFSFKYWNSLRKFIKTERPDIVHCLGLYTALLCILQKKIFRENYRIVCTVHRVSMNLRHKNLIRFVLRLIEKNIDATTFLTQFQKNHYYSNVRFRPEKYAVIPNVIFIAPTGSDEEERLRDELLSGMKADYIFAFVGRIVPGKNMEFFLRAIARLQEKGMNAGGVLVGGYEQPYYDSLNRIIDECKLGGKIKFIGYVNNPTAYIAASDFILFPTKSEALPNLLIESFATGKIVFSSDIPQMVDLIDEGHNGFTHSTDDINGFCDQIMAVASDPAKQHELTANAKLTYQMSYSPELVVSKYYQIYTDL